MSKDHHNVICNCNTFQDNLQINLYNTTRIEILSDNYGTHKLKINFQKICFGQKLS